MTSQVQISGGDFQDAEGNALVGGTLILQLSTPAAVVNTNQIASSVPIVITLGSGGNAPNTEIWGNDVLTPSGGSN